MKFLKTLLTLVLIAFFLPSCTDTHEAVVRDRISWLDNVTLVLNEVAEGRTTAPDAAERIKELGRDGAELVERKEALSNDATEAELQATVKEYADQTSQSLENYLQAVERVNKAGRMTPELSHALEDIDSP